MNQRSNNNGNRQQGGHQQMQQNEVTSARQQLQAVLRALNERGEELAGVLPPDQPLVAFLANVNQALRANPGLLRCTFESIVNACVKAAYDGLRIDGKEAAIVDAKESYKDGTVWRERAVARYMPMVYGLIKQILVSGAALTVKAVIVYQNEARTGRFTLLEGTTPGIQHQPFIEGEERGEMIGCYAIAEVVRGVFKFEWMDRAAILDVKKESKTDKVWTRWPTEMWKKTVVRRLRKSLSGTSAIRDMEATDLFPQFDRTTPHPQLADNRNAPARPTRNALPDYAGEGAGVPLDLGANGDGRELDEVESAQREQNREQPRQQEREQPRDQQRQQQKPAEPEVALPENDAAWGVWGLDLEQKIAAATTVEAIDKVWSEAQPIFKQATKAIKNRLTALVTERNADLALDGDGAGAASDQ